MDIVLATLNARYAHTAFGLRYLWSNLGALKQQAVIQEFTIKDAPDHIADVILEEQPSIVGFGVYIWNVEQTTRVITLLQAANPDIIVVLGGPEVSHEVGSQAITAMADHVVMGEGEDAFRGLCQSLLTGESAPHLVGGALPDVSNLVLPYDAYTDVDIERRVLYIEASRGCPFRCEFCLSSLDQKVRRFPTEDLLAALERLWQRGARAFKFVDRTFNLEPKVPAAILQFFLDRLPAEGLFLHFEMVPDRLSEGLKALLQQFPDGSVQLEIGVQTFNPEVAEAISRRLNIAKTEENLRWLASETGVHTHVDLIVGLPHEDLASFGVGFDKLWALAPDEIQVGVLKRLRGTPITRYDQAIVYDSHPPYTVLRTTAMSYSELMFLRRFAKLWDLVANSGHYPRALQLLLDAPSPFARFSAFAHHAYHALGRTHAIASNRLVEVVFEFLVEQGYPEHQVARALIEDTRGAHRYPLAKALRPYATEEECKKVVGPPRQRARQRQALRQ